MCLDVTLYGLKKDINPKGELTLCLELGPGIVEETFLGYVLNRVMKDPLDCVVLIEKVRSSPRCRKRCFGMERPPLILC